MNSIVHKFYLKVATVFIIIINVRGKGNRKSEKSLMIVDQREI
jgi:hypothetical protein